MLVMPPDDELIGPSIQYCTEVARQLGEDLRKDNVDLLEFIEEVSKLLAAVDAAISQTQFADDEQWEVMRRSWCFLGPDLLRQIGDLKILVSSGGQHWNWGIWLYTRAAFLQVTLIMRCQTLSLNGIDV